MTRKGLKQYWLKGVIATLVLIVWGGVSSDLYAQRKAIKRLEPLAFYKALSTHSNALVIDTRPAYKFEEYRLKDAVLAVSQKELLQVVKDQPKHRPLFVYCEIGDRSKRAGKVLAENGFTTIFELKGGLAVWMEQGLEIDSTLLK